MSQRRRQRAEEESDINVTPMLDIVFIMLIFFIVTTSFVKETGIDPVRPTAETAVSKPRGNILIGIDIDGFIWINKQRVELGQIRQIVEDAVNQVPESSAIVIADERSATGVVIEVMDQVRLGGVIDIAIAADPEST
jgi:biopolymer transport protein ExbD